MIQGLCQDISTENIFHKNDNTLIDWLEKSAEEYKLNYLLAHAEDGVIWGRFDRNKLTTAEQVFYQPNFDVNFPKLRLQTLQQCRIFGEQGEILLWRTDRGWKSRLVQNNSNVEHIKEVQILWGTQKEKGKNGQDGEKDGFTLLSDGSQGLKHAVPLTVISSYFNQEKKKLYRPVHLVINHYINYDEYTGIGQIFLSRLVSLELKKVNDEKAYS
ncbi:CRISPR-associated protein Csx19 [Scytonema sp. NUACC26]|uniref:type III-D CRISPR-associated protein Csx19 n=1 Tax=Scytonema sp. NUACC26 TaxID=3140176 RepID=UPI0034DBBAB1